MLYLELIGYLASLLIAISLMMTSILKLRWINLAGAITFTFYGFAIGAIPVGLMNLFIAGVNIYRLIGIYRQQDYFKILEVSEKDTLPRAFLSYYEKEIKYFYPKFFYKGDKHASQYLILRNMAIAGVFLATEADDKTLVVDLDFVIPEYRDFKPGKFLYHSADSVLKQSGYNCVVAFPPNKAMKNYFAKMRFQPKENNSDEELELLLG